MAGLVAHLRSALCFSSAAAQEHPGREDTPEHYSTGSHKVVGTQIQLSALIEQILLDAGLEKMITFITTKMSQK